MEYTGIIVVIIVTFILFRTGAISALSRLMEIGSVKIEYIADQAEAKDKYNNAKFMVKAVSKAEALMESNNGKIPTKKDLFKILDGKVNKEA